MASPFVAEIKMFGGNFAPRGYSFCNGQLIPIAQNTALFSLIGTFYGGNGQTTFALPNMQNNAPMHQGNGPGLTPRVIGESGGSSTVTLLSTQMPQHGHTAGASTAAAGDSTPNNEGFGANGRGRPQLYAGTAPTIPMAPTNQTGGGQPHNNRQPYLGVTFIIAVQGIFPPRN